MSAHISSPQTVPPSVSPFLRGPNLLPITPLSLVAGEKKTEPFASNGLVLAPLAGSTSLPFRRLAHQYGVGWTVTELVSARGLCYRGIRENFRYLALAPDEGPVAVQLFGSEPDDFARAIDILLNDPLSQHLAAIDLNLGCPVPKVVRQGAGSALMQNPSQVFRIAKACQQSLESHKKDGAVLPLTAKIRLGFEAGAFNAPDVALCLADAGVLAIAIHGRTRAQYYSGQADWQAIGKVVAALRPVHPQVLTIGNGDVVDFASAVALRRQSGCDAIMIGRGALGRPWLFQQLLTTAEHLEEAGLDLSSSDQAIQAALSDCPADLGLPSAAERAQAMRMHAQGLCELLGEAVALRELRSVLAPYFSQLPDAKSLRRLAGNLSSWAEVEALVSACELRWSAATKPKNQA